MKKICALLLAAVLILGALSISSSAVTEEKITDRLKEKMAVSADEQKIEVSVALQYILSDYQTVLWAHDQTARVTGIDKDHFQNTDEMKEYYRIFRFLMNEHKKGVVKDLMTRMGVTYDDISPDQAEYRDRPEELGVPTKYYLTKARISALTEVKEVVSVDFFGSFKIDDSLREALDASGEGESVHVRIWYDSYSRYHRSQFAPDDGIDYRREMLEDIGLTENEVAKDVGVSQEGWYFPMYFRVTEEQVNRVVLSEYVTGVTLLEGASQDDTNRGITLALSEMLTEASDDEAVNVWMIARPDYIDNIELERRTNEVCGELSPGSTLDEVNEWRRTRLRIMNDDRREKIRALLDELGIREDEVLSEWDFDQDVYWPCRFSLSKAKILSAAENDHVVTIDLYTGQDIPEDPFVDIPEDKITVRLKAKFCTLSEGERTEVWISSLTELSSQEVEELVKLTNEVCGFTKEEARTVFQLKRWMDTFRELYYTRLHAAAAGIVEKMGVDAEQIVSEWDADDIYTVMPTRFLLTQDDAERIAALEIDEIRYLDAYVDQDLLLEPVEPAIPGTDPVSLIYLRGDADGDDCVSVLDASCIQKCLASLIVDTDGLIRQNGDTDGDTELTVLDATAIQKFLAGYENRYHIGERITVCFDPSDPDD